METATKLCLIQLSRYGDIWQTLALMRDYRSRYPQTNVIFVGRKSFCEPLLYKIQEYSDQQFLIPSREELGKNAPDLASLKQFLGDLIQEINAFKIDISVNLSFSHTSHYLQGLIASGKKLGPHYDLAGKLVITDNWSQYVYSTVMRGEHNPYHLQDIFKNYFQITGPLNLTDMIPLQAREADRLHLEKEIIRKIVIHPFSSHRKKSWPFSAWVDILGPLALDFSDKEFVIVGSQSDWEQDAKNHSSLFDAPNIKNQLGKLTHAQLEAEIQSAQLFIGHDSMVGHIASFNGIQSLTISLGTVRPIETTPYGDENYSVSPITPCFPCFPLTPCEHLSCHSHINTQAITKVMSILIAKGELSEKDLHQEISGLYLDTLEINKTHLHPLGQMYFENLIGKPNLKSIFAAIYRTCWNLLLFDQEENIPIPTVNSQLAKELLNYKDGLKKFHDLNHFGQQYSKFILEEHERKHPDLVKIKEYTDKMIEIDQLALLLQKKFPLLSPLIEYYCVVRMNIPGDNILQMSSNSLLSFKESQCAANILQELIDQLVAQSDYQNSKGLGCDTSIT